MDVHAIFGLGQVAFTCNFTDVSNATVLTADSTLLTASAPGVLRDPACVSDPAAVCVVECTTPAWPSGSARLTVGGHAVTVGGHAVNASGHAVNASGHVVNASEARPLAVPFFGGEGGDLFSFFPTWSALLLLYYSQDFFFFFITLE